MVKEINLSDLKLEEILKCKTETPFSLRDFRLFLSKQEDKLGLRYLEYYEWMRWYNVFYYNNIEAYNNGTYRAKLNSKLEELAYDFPNLNDFDYVESSVRNSEVLEPADILADYIDDDNNNNTINNETFVSDSTGSRTIRINHLPFSDMVLEMLHAFFNPKSPLFFPVPTNIFRKVHNKLGRSTDPMVFQPIAKFVYDKLNDDFYPDFINSVVKESVLRDRIIWLLSSILFLFILGIIYWRLAIAKLYYPVYIACLPLWLIIWFCLLNTIFGIPPSNYLNYLNRIILGKRRTKNSRLNSKNLSLQHSNTSKLSQISIGSTKVVNYKTKHRICLFICLMTFLAVYFTAMGLFIPLKLYNLY